MIDFKGQLTLAAELNALKLQNEELQRLAKHQQIVIETICKTLSDNLIDFPKITYETEH